MHKDNLPRFRGVRIHHLLGAVSTVLPTGPLCVAVWESCQRHQNPTPLATIMRGLLSPDQQKEAEVTSSMIYLNAYNHPSVQYSLERPSVKQKSVSVWILSKWGLFTAL